MEHHTKRRRLAALASTFVVLYLADEFLAEDEYSEISQPQYKGKLPGSTTIFREQTEDTHNFLHLISSRLFCQPYHLKKSSFFNLLEIIGDYLTPACSHKRKRGKTPNGPITHPLRLSMAIRYFAGGDPLDIADVHKVGDDQPLINVWHVVNAINAVRDLKIKFPSSHREQVKIARGFKAKSSINIDNCVGAIDGILIWIHKPDKDSLERFGVGPAKFFSGRKGKFGLNMQAVCDADGRFLDVYIGCPGSASDYYSFDGSPLKKLIEEPGFCLFGDNAYLNTPYMLTPFRNVSKETDPNKDGFNFYQSQVRINIECAFGRLVHRWGILRKPIPMNIGVDKTMHMVLASCKLATTQFLY